MMCSCRLFTFAPGMGACWGLNTFINTVGVSLSLHGHVYLFPVNLGYVDKKMVRGFRILCIAGQKSPEYDNLIILENTMLSTFLLKSVSKSLLNEFPLFKYVAALLSAGVH